MRRSLVLVALLTSVAGGCGPEHRSRDPADDGAVGRDASEPAPDGTSPDAGTCDPYDPGEDPFADHLVGWWALDQDTRDQSPSGHHCLAVGNAHLVQDAERGQVLELDGDGDYLDCGNEAALDLSTAMSFALWVRVRSFAVAWQTFLSRNGEECGWSIRRAQETGGADFALRGTAAIDDLQGTRALDDGAWHHVAGVYDGAQRILYVDGEVDAQWSDSGPATRCPADHVLIGAMGAESFGYGHNGHDGWLDDVRIYDAAIDAQAVRRLAGLGRTAHQPEPADGAQGIAPTATLSWQPGVGSCGHHLYLGTDESAVRDALDPDSPPGRGVLSAPAFDPGPLDQHTTYYWRVDEVTAAGVAPGPVWRFHTCGESENGFVLIPAGSFTMGASPGDSHACRTGCGWPFDIEKPHTVNITRDIWMKEHEVTHGEWAAAFGASPGGFVACGDDCPVENITWWQMLAYCNHRSLAEGRPVCYHTDSGGTVVYDMSAANGRQAPYWLAGPACLGYRLPTEAEWEYAARAGTTTPIYHGDGTPVDANVDPIAWYMQNSQCSYSGCDQENCRDSMGIGPAGTHPVARKVPNAWGLYDMYGNVWEFVWDFFGEYHDGPVDDPIGPAANQAGFHVARGGCWLQPDFVHRASTRDGDDATCDQDNGPGVHVGFRIVRTAQ